MALIPPFKFVLYRDIWYNSGMAKKKTSITLSDEALRLLELLAKKQGISRTAVLEIVIREKAKTEGVK